MAKTENFEKVEVHSSSMLRKWLEQNHSQEKAIWLVTFKKSVPEKYVSVSEILDEILCFGWIDGVRRKVDDQRTMQLISPRRTQHWAKTYKERAQKLIEEGKMAEAGVKSIEESKKNGLWNFMDDVDALVKPQDLIEALAAYPDATAYFDAFPASSQRFILRWIKLAKKEETRSKRIVQTAKLAAQNERIPGS